MTKGEGFRSSHLVLLALALAAMLLRAFIPVGYMPAEHRSGGTSSFQLIICDGHGKTSVQTVDLGGVPKPLPNKSGHDSLCAYSGGVLGAAPDAVEQAYAMDLSLAVITNDRWTDLAPGRGLIAPPPPQTGPPAFL